MAYQVAEIGACATCCGVQGRCDNYNRRVAYDKNLIEWIKESVEFIAEVLIYPGEDEMQSLAEGVLRDMGEKAKYIDKRWY